MLGAMLSALSVTLLLYVIEPECFIKDSRVFVFMLAGVVSSMSARRHAGFCSLLFC